MCANLPAMFTESLLGRLLRKLKLLPTPPAQFLDPETSKLWLYDNIAFPSPTNPEQWSAEFIAAFFSTATPAKDVSAVVADIAEKLGLGEGDEAEALIAERVQPFLDIILENRKVKIVFDDSGEIVLGPSDGKGVAVNKLGIPGEWKDRDRVVSRDIDGKTEMVTRFFGGEGWAVVSGSYTHLPSKHRVVNTPKISTIQSKSPKSATVSSF